MKLPLAGTLERALPGTDHTNIDIRIVHRLFRISYLGFGVPYFNTFFNGTIVKYKFILFSPWLLKRPVMIAVAQYTPKVFDL